MTLLILYKFPVGGWWEVVQPYCIPLVLKPYHGCSWISYHVACRTAGVLKCTYPWAGAEGYMEIPCFPLMQFQCETPLNWCRLMCGKSMLPLNTVLQCEDITSWNGKTLFWERPFSQEYGEKTWKLEHVGPLRLPSTKSVPSGYDCKGRNREEN